MKKVWKLLPFAAIICLILVMVSCNSAPGPDKLPSAKTWQEILEHDLHLLGHRNWILIVDKAFPEQSSPGMKYIYVEQDLVPTLKYVLESVESSTHVSPIIYRDQELIFIAEEQVPGIEAFRQESREVLGDREVNSLLHDEVFQMLDESSSLFRTLVIKTNCTLPYTSVFLQLDCSYWGSENEKVLRKTMAEKDPD